MGVRRVLLNPFLIKLSHIRLDGISNEIRAACGFPRGPIPYGSDDERAVNTGPGIPILISLSLPMLSDCTRRSFAHVFLGLISVDMPSLNHLLITWKKKEVPPRGIVSFR